MSFRWVWFHRSMSFHSFNRRLTVRLLAPNSEGRSRQPMPVRSRNTRELKTVRLSIGGLPPFRLTTGWANNEPMRRQSSSVTRLPIVVFQMSSSEIKLDILDKAAKLLRDAISDAG